VDEATARLRHRLLAEENDEYLDAALEGNTIEIADALGDQLYILCGTLLIHGMGEVIEEVFQAIQASNMSKLGSDGKPIYREDGKVMKGPNYFRPDIASVLESCSARRSK
jgi:predicted HAD superfamily Cof-like phosphohydrolase